MKGRWSTRDRLLLLLALAGLASPITLAAMIGSAHPETLLAWAVGIEICVLVLLVYLVVTSTDLIS